jgi:hypothetical protein
MDRSDPLKRMQARVDSHGLNNVHNGYQRGWEWHPIIQEGSGEQGERPARHWVQRTADKHLKLRIKKELGEQPGKKGSRGGGSQRIPEGGTGTSEPQWGRWVQPM